MRRGKRQGQLSYLFHQQNGLCHICSQPAVLDGNGGKAGSTQSAVRFRTGSSFGEKGRVRPRVMAHRGCAQKRSDEIQASQPIEDMWRRARNEPTEYYKIPEALRA